MMESEVFDFNLHDGLIGLNSVRRISSFQTFRSQMARASVALPSANQGLIISHCSFSESIILIILFQFFIFFHYISLSFVVFHSIIFHSFFKKHIIIFIIRY
jgi:hypothetical protein